MTDNFHANYGGYSYELIVGENEACVIEFSPTDNGYSARWFDSTTDAMAWWAELDGEDDGSEMVDAGEA